MAEINEVAATTTTEVAKQQTDSILSNSDQPIVEKDSTVLDTAGQEEKAAQEAESKRLLEADPKTLNPEDLTKREALVKEQEAVKAKEEDDRKAKSVPEKYEIKPPEGMTFDEAKMSKVYESFKKNGFSNDQAQNMVNLFHEQMKANEVDGANNFKKFLEDSAKETMTALGSNAKTELAYVAKVKNLFSPETIELLSASGMGNQKSFILDLAKVGRMFSEEKNVDTGKGSAGGKDPAETLYPTMNK